MTFVHLQDSGLTLLFERRRGPGFALELRLPLGAAHDPDGAQGAAALLEEWLHRGAGDLDARQLAAAFDDLGLRRGGGLTHEETRFSVSGLSADLGRALELIALTVQRPRLEEREFPILLDLARQDLESLADSPAEQLGLSLRERAFAPPYAHPVGGTLASLGALTPDGVRAFLQHYGGRGAVLAVVADLDEEEVRALAQRHFGHWNGGPPALPEAVFHGDFYAHLGGDKEQTQLALVYPGVGPRHPDWLPLHLALTVLSGGSASRLFQEVREERGLAYSVGAGVQLVGAQGFVGAQAGTTPERAQGTLDVMLGEFARLARGVTPAEFVRARAQLLTALVFAAESARGRAATLARDWLSLGRVRAPGELRAGVLAVTLDDLNAFLARFPFARPAVMTLGPAPLVNHEGSYVRA